MMMSFIRRNQYNFYSINGLVKNETIITLNMKEREIFSDKNWVFDE